MNFDAVETGPLGAIGAGRELADDELDVVFVHHLQRHVRRIFRRRVEFLRQKDLRIIPFRRIGIRRRPERPPFQNVDAADQAAMMDLRRNLAAMAVHGVGKLFQPRQETVVGNGDLPQLIAADRPGHARNARDDEPHAARRLLLVVADDLLAAMAVFLGHRHAHRRDGDAVARLHGSDAALGHQMRVGAHGGVSFFYLRPVSLNRLDGAAPAAIDHFRNT